MQFGLRAGFKTNLVLFAVAGNLLDDRTHLVDLDRVDDKAFGFVVVFVCRNLETF